MGHPISAFVPGELGGIADQIAKDCISLKSSDLDTKAGREKAFKDAAKCSAEAACAVYSKGMIPPGVCSSIVGPIANAAVEVWDGVSDFFSTDDAHEREVLHAQIALPHAVQQLKFLSYSFTAHYFNVAGGLIELHDKLFPDKKGTLGGGKASVSKITPTGQTGIPVTFTYKNYSINNPAMKRLTAAGAPPAKCVYDGPWCDAPDLWAHYSNWVQAHGTASSPEQLQQVKSYSTVHSQWMLDLNRAVLRVQADLQAEAVKRLKEVEDAAKKTEETKTRPLVVGAGVVGAGIVGAAGLGYLVWSKGWLKGIL